MFTRKIELLISNYFHGIDTRRDSIDSEKSKIKDYQKKKMTAKSGGDGDPVNEEYLGNVTEVGTQAVWSLSSCKPGMDSNTIFQ